jgi:hypothetical protein
MDEEGSRNGVLPSEEAQCRGPMGRLIYWGPWKICLFSCYLQVIKHMLSSENIQSKV